MAFGCPCAVKQHPAASAGAHTACACPCPLHHSPLYHIFKGADSPRPHIAAGGEHKILLPKRWWQERFTKGRWDAWGRVSWQDQDAWTRKRPLPDKLSYNLPSIRPPSSCSGLCLRGLLSGLQSGMSTCWGSHQTHTCGAPFLHAKPCHDDGSHPDSALMQSMVPQLGVWSTHPAANACRIVVDAALRFLCRRHSVEGEWCLW